METLIKADIFFFVTTIAVMVLTILISLCLMYLFEVLKNLRDITEVLKNGVHNAEERVEEFIERVEGNALFRFVFGQSKQATKKKATRKKKTSL